jgi:hypothetical protein
MKKGLFSIAVITITIIIVMNASAKLCAIHCSRLFRELSVAGFVSFEDWEFVWGEWAPWTIVSAVADCFHWTFVSVEI